MRTLKENQKLSLVPVKVMALVGRDVKGVRFLPVAEYLEPHEQTEDKIRALRWVKIEEEVSKKDMHNFETGTKSTVKVLSYWLKWVNFPRHNGECCFSAIRFARQIGPLGQPKITKAELKKMVMVTDQALEQHEILIDKAFAQKNGLWPQS